MKGWNLYLQSKRLPTPWYTAYIYCTAHSRLSTHWYTLTSSRYQILPPLDYKSFRRLLAVIVQSTQQLLLEKWTFLLEKLFVFLSGNRLYFMARARCISCMLWELFATPASRLLPLIRCPHPHFFPEGTNIQTISTTNLSKDFVHDFSHEMVDFKGQGGSVIVGQRGEGPEVLNIVIFLQLHDGEGRRIVPQRRCKNNQQPQFRRTTTRAWE